MEEASVLQILTQVNVVRRECEIVSIRSRETAGAPLEMRAPVTAFPSLPRNWRRPTLTKRRRSISGSS